MHYGMTELALLCEELLTKPRLGLRDTALRLGKLLASKRETDIQFNNPTDGESYTAQGLAVSPKWAEMCLDDYIRTVCFIRGVDKAITETLAQVSNRPVRILYAGCGPFGTLCVPLMTRYAPVQAQFTFVDIHCESIKSVKSIVANLGLSEHVKQYIQNDIMSLRLNDTNPPDIVVVEVMQSALDKEPQVAAARHLLNQAPNAIMVPIDVSIELSLVNIAQEFQFGSMLEQPERDRVKVGNVFRLNKQSICEWADIDRKLLPAAELTLPDYDKETYQPMLMTRISCSSEDHLGDYDSGLTIPRIHSCLHQALPNSKIQFNYKLGDLPGLISSASNENGLHFKNAGRE